MTAKRLKEAQELSARIERLKRLVSRASPMLYLVGTGEDREDLVCMSDFDGCVDAHRAIIAALNGLLEKLQAEFEKM